MPRPGGARDSARPACGRRPAVSTCPDVRTTAHGVRQEDIPRDRGTCNAVVGAIDGQLANDAIVSGREFSIEASILLSLPALEAIEPFEENAACLFEMRVASRFVDRTSVEHRHTRSMRAAHAARHLVQDRITLLNFCALVKKIAHPLLAAQRFGAAR